MLKNHLHPFPLLWHKRASIFRYSWKKILCKLIRQLLFLTGLFLWSSKQRLHLFCEWERKWWIYWTKNDTKKRKQKKREKRVLDSQGGFDLMFSKKSNIQTLTTILVRSCFLSAYGCVSSVLTLRSVKYKFGRFWGLEKC